MNVSARLIQGIALSENFNASFENAGYLIGKDVFTIKVSALQSKPIKLSKIIEKNGVDGHYFLSESKKKQYQYLRGSKKIKRKNKAGHEYFYSEGSMSPYDDLTLPARTMLTSEGTTNRSTHIIMDPKESRLRILTPVECERINQFPDNWTNSGMPGKQPRAHAITS